MSSQIFPPSKEDVPVGNLCKAPVIPGPGAPIEWHPLPFASRITSEDKIVSGIGSTVTDTGGVWSTVINAGAGALSPVNMTLYSFPLPPEFVGDGRDTLLIDLQEFTDAEAGGSGGARGAIFVGAGLIQTPGTTFSSEPGRDYDVMVGGHYRWTTNERFTEHSNWAGGTFGPGINRGADLAFHRTTIPTLPHAGGFRFDRLSTTIAAQHVTIANTFDVVSNTGDLVAAFRGANDAPMPAARARFVICFGRATVGAGPTNTLSFRPRYAVLRTPE